MAKQQNKFRYPKPTGKLIDDRKNLFEYTECAGRWLVNLLPGPRQPRNHKHCSHCGCN
jgi:hypothetical protein